MRNAKQVDAIVAQLTAEGAEKATIVWQAAIACTGWPYVFGARGEYCTVANRHSRYSSDHPTIRTACKGYDSGSCTGCKWYPSSERVRCYDCRGFTFWCLKQAGIPLAGAGATSQWNTAANWAAKGKISDGLPRDTLVCLFAQKGNKMEHTGFGLNDETVECSSGVQHFAARNKKWTHWAVPQGLYGSIPDPEPVPETKPTLRRGNKGTWVTKLQVMLVNRGYELPKYGADGDFGKETEAAVIRFQADHGLISDGVVGAKTWEALEQTTEKVVTYTVTVTGLTKSKADEIISKYGGSKTAEN